MTTEILALMIPILSILGFFLMVIYWRKYDNKERMAMIEKGISPELFRRKKPSRGDMGALRSALLFIGVGVGFLLGYFLDRFFDMNMVGYAAMLFIFGGTGLGVSYILEERKAKQDLQENE